VQTRRLAESFEPLNSFLPLSEPGLRSRKATCNPVSLAQNYQNLPDAKELKFIEKIEIAAI